MRKWTVNISATRMGIALCMLMAAAVAHADQERIKEIEVRGNIKVSTAAIRANMRLKEGQIFNNSQMEDDKNSINGMGWFSKVDLNPELLSDNTYRILVQVKENPVIKEISIFGNSAIPTEELIPLITFKPAPGKPDEELRPFNLSQVKATATNIRDYYTKKGFFGRLDNVTPDPSSPGTYLVVIQELRVRSVTVQGLTNTKPSVFNRLIKTKPGDPYNQRTWDRDYQRIINTQWFEGINASLPTLDDSETGLVDLKVALNDGQTGQFNAGVVLDPQNSLAGTLAWSDNNFLGSGRSVGFNYTQATVGLGGSVSLDYTDPFLYKDDTTLRASIYDRVSFRFANNLVGGGVNPTDNQYSERRTGASLALSKPINDYLSNGLSARFERINVPTVTSSTTSNFIQQDGEVAVLGITSVYNSRDIDFDPAKGRFLRWDLEPGYSVIRPESTATSPEGRFGFLRSSFDYRSYSTKDKRPRTSQDSSREVFALRLRGGTIQGTVPFFEQFFAGGNDSIRGYFEDRFWGTNRFIANFEWRKPVQDSLSFVTFIDWGGAWGGYSSLNDFTQTNKFRAHVGYGFGIRLRTPVGPVRLDYGFNSEGGSRPHFAIGTNF